MNEIIVFSNHEFIYTISFKPSLISSADNGEWNTFLGGDPEGISLELEISSDEISREIAKFEAGTGAHVQGGVQPIKFSEEKVIIPDGEGGQSEKTVFNVILEDFDTRFGRLMNYPSIRQIALAIKHLRARNEGAGIAYKEDIHVRAHLAEIEQVAQQLDAAAIPGRTLAERGAKGGQKRHDPGRVVKAAVRKCWEAWKNPALEITYKSQEKFALAMLEIPENRVGDGGYIIRTVDTIKKWVSDWNKGKS